MENYDTDANALFLQLPSTPRSIKSALFRVPTTLLRISVSSNIKKNAIKKVVRKPYA